MNVFCMQEGQEFGEARDRMSWADCMCPPTSSHVEALIRNVMVFGAIR